MSTQNQISIEIPQEILVEVTTKLQECKAKLAPFLQGLTAEDRLTMLKMGDKTVATVQKTKSYMETNPEFIPSYLDKPEFLKDEAVATQLSPIENLATQLATDISDTVMLAGSEALYAALLYYGQVREAHLKGIPTAKPIYEDLSERFAKGKKKGVGKE
jgi:phage gpG-like protein